MIDLSGKLPVIFQKKIWRFTRWQDRQAALFSKLLLQKCLYKYGFPSNCLSRIVEDDYGRPFIDNQIDFNISHSSDYVLCAMTNTCRLGIDIERIKHISLTDFYRVLTAEQSEKIKASSNVYKEFFKIWTKNESILKADGRGLSIPFSEIENGHSKALLNGNVWYIKKIDVDSGYSCHLASEIESPRINLEKVKFH